MQLVCIKYFHPRLIADYIINVIMMFCALIFETLLEYFFYYISMKATLTS